MPVFLAVKEPFLISEMVGSSMPELIRTQEIIKVMYITALNEWVIGSDLGICSERLLLCVRYVLISSMLQEMGYPVG